MKNPKTISVPNVSKETLDSLACVYGKEHIKRAELPSSVMAVVMHGFLVVDMTNPIGMDCPAVAWQK